MTNQAMLDEIQCAWTVIKNEHPEYPNLANKLEQALGQLRVKLKEPTDEEREKMLETLEQLWDTDGDGVPLCEETFDSIRAAIKAKRTVTRQEIRRVVQENWEYATGTIIDAAACDIWEERTVEFLEHFGIGVKE